MDKVSVDAQWYERLLHWVADQGCGCEKLKGWGGPLPCDQCKARKLIKEDYDGRW